MMIVYQVLVFLIFLRSCDGQGADPSAQLAIRNAMGAAQTVVDAGNTAAVAGFAISRGGAPIRGGAGAMAGAPGAAGMPPALVQQQRFNREMPRTRAQRQPTMLRLETARQLTTGTAAGGIAGSAGFAVNATGTPVGATVSYEALSTQPVWINSWQAELGCPTRQIPACDPSSPFRTADGSCNNLNNPEWGQSFTPQERYLPPQYDDNIDSPRTRSVIFGQTLPSARLVSRTCLRNAGPTTLNNRNTFMLMAWGQFLDHDITSTPAQKEPNGDPILCCGMPPRPECFNIDIPLPDPFYTSDCMNFVRSSPALADPCLPSRRQQINQLTSYHDASNVYGSTLTQMNNLRANGGLSANLATRAGNLPPEDPDPDACITGPGDYCPLGGDHRISEVVFLGANHVTWLRMHNLIVDELRTFGNPWSEERLFQETRKIIGALQQHITYDEYLPAMLNPNYRSAFCLTEFCQVYSQQINGAIKNSFSTAVLRMGHSQIPSAIGYVTPDHTGVLDLPLRNHFNRPNLYIREMGTRVDDMQRYVTSRGAARTDRLLELEISDHLFTDGTLSFDLGALNIQRGRDHGLPAYVWFREFCGLPRVYFFSSGPGGLSSHSAQAVFLLRQVYRHHNDIDLYVGALSETPVPGGELGPTFSCLFALQMRDLKVGDRFFWSRPDPVTGLTFAQRNAIRNTRLSTVLCQAISDMQVVQPNVFFYPGPGNQLRPCWSVPRLNLNPWRAGFRGRGEGGAGGGGGGGGAGGRGGGLGGGDPGVGGPGLGGGVGVMPGPINTGGIRGFPTDRQRGAEFMHRPISTGGIRGFPTSQQGGAGFMRRLISTGGVRGFPTSRPGEGFMPETINAGGIWGFPFGGQKRGSKTYKK